MSLSEAKMVKRSSCHRASKPLMILSVVMVAIKYFNHLPMLTEEQIQQMVMARYPKTDKERNCNQEKQRLAALRELYRDRLRAENTQSVSEPPATI